MVRRARAWTEFARPPGLVMDEQRLGVVAAHVEGDGLAGEYVEEAPDLGVEHGLVAGRPAFDALGDGGQRVEVDAERAGGEDEVRLPRREVAGEIVVEGAGELVAGVDDDDASGPLGVAAAQFDLGELIVEAALRPAQDVTLFVDEIRLVWSPRRIRHGLDASFHRRLLRACTF